MKLEVSHFETGCGDLFELHSVARALARPGAQSSGRGEIPQNSGAGLMNSMPTCAFPMNCVPT